MDKWVHLKSLTFTSKDWNFDSFEWWNTSFARRTFPGTEFPINKPVNDCLNQYEHEKFDLYYNSKTKSIEREEPGLFEGFKEQTGVKQIELAIYRALNFVSLYI